MLFRKKTPRLFELYEPKRFRTTKLDIFVVTVVVIVFTWGFFIDSFQPLRNETGDIIYVETQRGFKALPRINLQFFIAPLIFVYEILVLIMLDGKLKGRDLPWGLYFVTFKIVAKEKLSGGIEEYKNWRKLKKK